MGQGKLLTTEEETATLKAETAALGRSIKKFLATNTTCLNCQGTGRHKWKKAVTTYVVVEGECGVCGGTGEWRRPLTAPDGGTWEAWHIKALKGLEDTEDAEE